MSKNEKTSITINEKEYIIEDMSDEAKVWLLHLDDFDRKIATNEFTQRSLRLGRQQALEMLAETLEKEPEPEKLDA